MVRIQYGDEERRESIVGGLLHDNFSVTFCPRRVGRRRIDELEAGKKKFTYGVHS